MSDKIEKFIVELESNVRLDKYLTSKINNITRSKVQQLIKDGHVSLNDKIIKDTAYKAKSNDEIAVVIKKPEAKDILPRKMDLDIVYEDDYLAIINKASGVTTHPGAGNHNDTLVNGLMAHFKNNLSNVGGAARPGIVHRLDKNTSGLMVIAKDDSTHAKLSHQLQLREVKRIYNALVWGVPINMSGTIRNNIGRSRQDRKKMQVLETGGKVAITNYKVLQVFLNNAFSLVECALQTGRTHQIRVHLKHLGYPIVGDPEYGHARKKRKYVLSSIVEKYITSISRQMLHAKRISFIHPVTQKHIDYEIDLPYDMQNLITIFQNESQTK